MEKKTVARVLQATKGTNGDTKFKQDVQPKFPRTSRKREGVRSDPSKKPIPQRNRTSNDKRPRPRAANLWDRDDREVVDDALAEAGSMLQHGQKKMNLNHLLNFKLSPREIPPRVREKVRLPKYNKEQFLQANCQFVVKQDGKYVQHSSDPDLLVDWNHVEEVRIPCFEIPSCPICLYQPTAAKITRCGHIYCWPCILHYLTVSARTWCTCPICHEPVLKDDLKSVMPAMRVAPKMQNEITMCLMKRKKGQLIALPVSGSKFTVNCGLFNIHDDLRATCFQKLLTASKKDVQRFVVDREFNELQSLHSSADDSEIVFIEESFELLKKRRDLLHYENSFDALADNLSSLLVEDEIHPGALDGERLSTEADSNSTANYASSSSSAQDSFFYFYQATDGQHIYLNPLNIRMLVEEYGSLQQSPEFLTCKIIDIERFTVTDNVRRRLRYLQHLPLTCEFQVVELQLLPPVLSSATCSLFHAEVEKRRRARNKKAREESRRDKRIEMEENRKLGKYPEARYCLESIDHFPSCRNDPVDQDDPIPVLENPETESPLSEVSSPLETSSTASFAQMLRSGKVRPHVTRESQQPVPAVVEDVDNDEGASPPAYWQSFSNALDNCAFQQNSVTKTGKGKKKSKMLLFTTAINRSK